MYISYPGAGGYIFCRHRNLLRNATSYLSCLVLDSGPDPGAPHHVVTRGSEPAYHAPEGDLQCAGSRPVGRIYNSSPSHGSRGPRTYYEGLSVWQAYAVGGDLVVVGGHASSTYRTPDLLRGVASKQRQDGEVVQVLCTLCAARSVLACQSARSAAVRCGTPAGRKSPKQRARSEPSDHRRDWRAHHYVR